MIEANTLDEIHDEKKRPNWVVTILFIISILLFVVSQIFLWMDVPGGITFFLVSFVSVVVYSMAKMIKSLIKKDASTLILIYRFFMVLMSGCFFTKYFYHPIGNVPTLFILPVFVLLAVWVLFTNKGKDVKLTIYTVIYLFFVLPLFGVPLTAEKPTQYFSSKTSFTEDTQSAVIEVPGDFENEEAYELAMEGKDSGLRDYFWKPLLFIRKHLN